MVFINALHLPAATILCELWSLFHAAFMRRCYCSMSSTRPFPHSSKCSRKLEKSTSICQTNDDDVMTIGKCLKLIVVILLWMWTEWNELNITFLRIHSKKRIYILICKLIKINIINVKAFWLITWFIISNIYSKDLGMSSHFHERNLSGIRRYNY